MSENTNCEEKKTERPISATNKTFYGERRQIKKNVVSLQMNIFEDGSIDLHLNAKDLNSIKKVANDLDDARFCFI